MKEELNVLVIDDNKGIRDLFTRILKGAYKFSTAVDGTEAVNLAKQRSFDMAFIDMRMPGLNGCETFIELKKIRPDITGIIMTGYCDENLRAESFLAGTVRYIDKPFDIVEIHELLNEVDFRRKTNAKNS